MEKLLFRLYLDQYFLDASEEAEDGALDYELEYIIVGKAKDEANLKGTVRRLLLMREAANLLFLETNAAKRQQTAAIALTLTSAIGHPELQPLVEQGVLAAWAYAESLSDMKILLNGGKVMPVRSARLCIRTFFIFPHRLRRQIIHSRKKDCPIPIICSCFCGPCRISAWRSGGWI